MPRGAFAQAPGEFAGSATISPMWNYFHGQPASVNQRGLRIDLPFVQHNGHLVGILGCFDEATDKIIGIALTSRLGILESLEILQRKPGYAVVRLPRQVVSSNSQVSKDVYIARTAATEVRDYHANRRHTFRFRLSERTRNSWHLTGWWPSQRYDQGDDDGVITLHPLNHNCAHTIIIVSASASSRPERQTPHLCVGFGFETIHCAAIDTSKYWACVMPKHPGQ